jgi:hypothetical protein
VQIIPEKREQTLYGPPQMLVCRVWSVIGKTLAPGNLRDTWGVDWWLQNYSRVRLITNHNDRITGFGVRYIHSPFQCVVDLLREKA